MPRPEAQRILDRTIQFAQDIIGFTRRLPPTAEGRHVANQLLRSGTSVGANYRAARRARTLREFISKLGIVIEECDESLYWLELLARTCDVAVADRDRLLRESNELTSILVATRLRATRKFTTE